MDLGKFNLQVQKKVILRVRQNFNKLKVWI